LLRRSWHPEFYRVVPLEGGDETNIRTKTTTTGQELQDLKAAYDKGIITEWQYEQQKERLLSGK